MQELTSPHRLLLIEPSESTAAPIRGLLEQNGFVVDVLASVADARAHDLARYTLLIVDVAAGDQEGLQFVRWIHLVHSHLVGRVVVMTTAQHEALRESLSSIGICDVVPKPINAQEILRAVVECLEKNPVLAVQ